MYLLKKQKTMKATNLIFVENSKNESFRSSQILQLEKVKQEFDFKNNSSNSNSKKKANFSENPHSKNEEQKILSNSQNSSSLITEFSQAVSTKSAPTK